jgi:hypothetical protein
MTFNLKDFKKWWKPFTLFDHDVETEISKSGIQSSDLLQAIIHNNLSNESFDIGLQGESSIISYNIYDNPPLLTLVFDKASIFSIELDYYNEKEGKYKNVKYQLLPSDILMIPEGLVELMRKSRDTQETIYVEKGMLG